MIKVFDSRLLAVNTPLDAKVSNCYLDELLGEMVIESIPEFLSRIKASYRSPNTLVSISVPKEGFCTGSFSMEDYVLIQDNYDGKFYSFQGGLNDSDFKEVVLGDKNYRFTQDMPAKIWYVSHNLNKNPSVTITDTAGSVFVGYIDYTDKNNLVITLNAETSGIAEMN